MRQVAGSLAQGPIIIEQAPRSAMELLKTLAVEGALDGNSHAYSRRMFRS